MKGKFITRYLTKKLLDSVTSTLDSSLTQFVYTVDISALAWSLPALCEVFSCIGTQVSNLPGNDNKASISQPSLFNEPEERRYYKLYHGTPIVMTVNKDNGGNVFVKFKTLNEKHCKETLDLFVSKLCKHQLRMNKDKWQYSNNMNHSGRGSFRPSIDIKRRTFNDVFMKSSDKELLLNTIDNFIVKRKWYMDNNLPYHIGVLLYGPPGTGKSVIAQAIADYTKARLLILNGDDIGFISESLDYSSYKPTDDSYTVYLIEDVDCGFYMKDIVRPMTFNGNLDYDDDDDLSDGSDRKRRPDGLATILNCLDGIGAPNNVIYVLTTNHIENLDPALIRPGRCDLKIEIGYVNEETFKQFIKFHYNEEINYPITINRNITFAELQVYTMRGYTVAQLIELMGECNNEDIGYGGNSV